MKREKSSGWIFMQLLVCDDSSVAIARSIWNLRAPPRPWSSLLSGTDETEFYRQLALFTAFLEPITRLSPPHQPRVSTHWRTVKNLLSLSCSPQELGAMERILLSLLKWMKRRIESSRQVSLTACSVLNINIDTNVFQCSCSTPFKEY